MSAKGQKRTSRLFDHLVGASDKRVWDVEAQYFCSLQIDSQADFCRLLDWQVARLLTLEKTPCVNASLPIRFRRAVSIAHQATGNDKIPCRVDRGHSMLSGQRGELSGMTYEQCIGVDQKGIRLQLSQSREGRIDLRFGACAQDVQLHAQCTRSRQQVSFRGFCDNGISRIDERRNDSRLGQ